MPFGLINDLKNKETGFWPVSLLYHGGFSF